MRKILFIAIMLWPSLAYAQTSQNGRIMEGALATRPATCSNSDVFIANDSDPPLNFQCGSSNNWLAFAGGGGGGTPGGFNTDVQYNCGGVFCGDSNLTWDFTNKILGIQGSLYTKGPQPHIDVTAFGADPNATTDSTTAIQAAINFSCSIGGKGDIFFPPGNYKAAVSVSAAPQFTIPRSCSGLHFVGGNGSVAPDKAQFQTPPQAVIFTPNCSGTGSGPMFLIENGTLAAATQGGTGSTFSNLGIVGCNQGLWAYGVANVTFNNMAFGNTGVAGADSYALKITNSFFVYINGGTINNFNPSVAGVLLDAETPLGTEPSEVQIVNFRNTIFNGAVLFDQRVTTPNQSGAILFDGVQAEIGGSSVPFFTTQCEASCNAFGPLNISYSGVSDNNSGTPLIQLRGFARYNDVTVIDSNGSATGSPAINADNVVFDCMVIGGGFSSRTVVTATGTAQSGCVTQNFNGFDFTSAAGGLSNSNPFYRTDMLTQSGFFGGNEGPAIRMTVAGDTNARLAIDPSAGLAFGPGASTGGFDAQFNRTGSGAVGISLTTTGTFPGSPQFTFNTTGLGVGTTSPSYGLDVFTTARHQNYVDFTEIAAPANPSAGNERVWADNSTHLLTCKVSSGASCISGGGGGGSFQVNGVGLISTTTINFQNSVATTGLTLGFTNPSAGNVQLTLSGTLTIAGGGTGQTTKTAAFDALSPTTTQGDIILNNGTNNVRLAIGTNTQVLTSNGTTASWQTPSTVTGSGATTQCTFWSSSTAITGSANCTYSAASGISLIQGANAADMIYGKRATDVAPTGNFWHFQNAAANSDIATLDVNGNMSIAQKLTTGTGAATHFVAIPEGTTAGAQTGFDVLSADSVTHTLQVSNNNLSFSAVPLFASNTLTAHTVLVTNSTFPLLTQVGPGVAGQCFVSNGASSDPSFQGCTGSVNFNNILAATAANTPINNGDFAQKWNWVKTTNSTNGLEISEASASSATTASLFAVDTLSTSTLFPVTFTAGGPANGVQMSTTGTLSAIGSGNINATQCGGFSCVKTGVTLTTNFLPKATAATTLGNSLLSDNATTLTYTGAGGLALTTANAFISDTEGTAPSGSAGADLLWADSTAHAWKFINNNGSAQNVPAAQTCTNKVLDATDALATAGNCVTITSAFVNTSIAVTGVDINTSSQVTATHIAGVTTNTLMKSNGTGNMVNAAATDNGTQFAFTEPLDMTTKALVSDVTNDGTTGTTTSGLAKFTSTGAINIAVTDTSIPVFIIQSGGAVGGTSQFVQAGGQGDCRMDHSDSNTEGWFVIASVTIATDCHAQSAQPAAGIWISGTLVSNATTSGSTAKVAVLNTFSAIGSNTTCSPNAFPNAQTDAATVTWAIASAVCANATLTFTVHSGSRTLNLTGLVNGGSYVLKLIQDGTGGENLTGGTGCTWKQKGGGGSAFTLTNAPNALDVLAFTYDGTNCVTNIGLAYN